MATTFKPLGPNDATTTRTLLHEAIPLTGSIVSGTYAENNIKNYSHGMFQSVFDYPYLSSSANHVFDLACGFSNTSVLSNSSNTQNSKKINIYDQMSQVLVGHDVSGNIRLFDKDGNFAEGGDKLSSVYFINFSRLLTKDEIKKGSFICKMWTSGNSPFVSGGAAKENLNVIRDLGASSQAFTNSPAGEYGILYTGSAATASAAVGLLYYQAGVCVLTSSIFDSGSCGNHVLSEQGYWDQGFGKHSALHNSYTGSAQLLQTGSIQNTCDVLRHRLESISFNNTVELNSAIYFCRINHNEFNYSSNPTYLSASAIRVKGGDPLKEPVSYVTTVGLYGANRELLAVGKISEPLKNTPATETTLRVRLDY